VQHIYERVPEAAKCLASKFLEYGRDGPQENNGDLAVRGIHTSKKRPREDLSYRPSNVLTAKEDGSESLDKQTQNVRRSRFRIEPSVVDVIPLTGSKTSPRDAAIGTTQLCGKTMKEFTPAEIAMANKEMGTSATQSQLPAQTLPEQVRITEEAPRNIAGVPDGWAGSQIISPKAIVSEAVRSIHLLQKHPQGNSLHVYQQILQNVSHKQKFCSADFSEISHLSTWMQIMETTEAQKLRVTAFTMLELLGFSEWFNGLAKKVQLTQVSKKGKALGLKGVKTCTLNRLLGSNVDLSESIAGHDKVIESSLDEKLRRKKRASINSKLHRGEILSTKLVKDLGLGILFSPDIW
jgi:hypothetical protein